MITNSITKLKSSGIDFAHFSKDIWIWGMMQFFNCHIDSSKHYNAIVIVLSIANNIYIF